MWHVIAEEDMGCTECNHEIPTGGECISQMPPEMPKNVYRRKYENFCISCTLCDQTRSARPREGCYVRHLTTRYGYYGYTPDQKKTREPVPCAYCGKTIRKNTKTFVQKIYAWPDSGPEPKSENSPKQGSGVVAGASSSATAFRSGSGGWHNLSPETQQLFRTRGLGRGLGSRSPAMAQRLYEQSIPKVVRNAGDGAVREFLKGKDASHIRSVSNAPTRAKQPSNIVWENARANRARLGRNMTTAEVAAAKSANRTSAFASVAKSAAGRAARGGIFAAVTEAPIAGAENYLHWKRGRKSGRQATKDAAKSVGIAGGVGAAGAAVLGSVPLGPFGIPLMVGGIALFAAGGVARIVKAAKRDLPVDEYLIFFCSYGSCKTNFAREITKTARESPNWRFYHPS